MRRPFIAKRRLRNLSRAAAVEGTYVRTVYQPACLVKEECLYANEGHAAGKRRGICRSYLGDQAIANLPQSSISLL